MKNGIDGTLALGPISDGASSFVKSLFEQGQIPSASIAFQLSASPLQSTV